MSRTVVGPGGEIVGPVSVFLRDLLASGKSESTLRSYSVDLLRWWRFLDAVGVEWDRASRAEARDFSCWIQLTAKQRLQTSRPRAARLSSRAAGAPNPVTGKPASGDGYAPSTVAHSETVLRRFYDFHRDCGTGPVLNPFPLDASRRRAAARTRITTRWTNGCPSGPGATGRRCPSGSRGRSPTAGSTAVRVAAVGPGPGAGRVLDLHRGQGRGAAGYAPVRLLPGEQLISVVRKGTRAVQQLPGVGGRVRVASALPAGTASPGGAPGPAAAGLVDAAAPLPATELSRGPPDVRAGQRLARSGLDIARSPAFCGVQCPATKSSA